MAITASMVKELREMTGVGMLECKKALVETDGNMDEAVKILREKGLAAAQKKASRIAAEGLVDICLSDDNKKGVVVEVNSETDFVSKNEIFKNYVSDVARELLKSKAATVEEFLTENWKDDSVSVSEALNQQIAIIGEKLDIRRFERYEKETSGMLVSYIHGGGRIGVMLDIESESANAEVLEMGKNIAMQIAALRPKFIERGDVPQSFIDEEKEILTQQALNDEANAKKPANIMEKMIEGRLVKELKEFCLIEQAYVKDSEMSVREYIASVSKSVGAPIKVSRFVRFETGEGLAKREENFADEVAKIVK